MADDIGRTINRLGLPGIISTLTSLAKKVVRDKPWWIPDWLTNGAATIAAGIAAVVTTVLVQLWYAQEKLYEEHDMSDSFWSDRSQVNDFSGMVMFRLAAIATVFVVLGVATVMLASNPLTIPAAIGMGAALGGLIGIFKILPVVNGEFDNQKRILGYLS